MPTAPQHGAGRARPPRGRSRWRWLLADLAGYDPAEARWLAVLMALLSAAPFLAARHPQLTDYPAHLARYHVMLDIGHDAWLQRYYRFDWLWTGNLGADLLMLPLGRVLGVETAGWLIGLVIPPLTGLGIVAAEWAVRRRIGIGALLALTAIWSPAMSLGFYNFCLSLALALFAFALWVWMGEAPRRLRWRAAVFVPLGIVVWLCHASGWGVLGVLVFGYGWSRRRSVRDLPRALLAPWPLFAPLLLMLVGTAASAGPMPYGRTFWPYKISVAWAAMRDQHYRLDLATPLLLIAAMAVAMACRRFDGRFGWAAWLLAALFVAVPRHLGGGDYADYRLLPVALMVGCLAIDWRAPRLVLWLAPLLFLVRLEVTTAAWHANGRVLERDLAALDHLPPGARVAGAVLVERAAWPLNPFEHVPAYATTRRDALVNAHFAIPGVHMLSLRRPLPGFVDPSQRLLREPGEAIDLRAFPPAAHADYLWYIGRLPPTALPTGARVLYANPHSLLLRLANRAPSR